MMASFTRTVTLSLASVALLLLPARLLGQVAVGQKVDLNLKTIDGKPTGTKSLAGKVVILDFWATWCGPCMQEVPHMTQINESMGPKGVQIVGISLDQSVAALRPVIEQKNMKWLHVHDSDKQLSKQFAVSGIPRVFVLGPDSTVRWTGHPANLDKALAEIMEKYPPVLVDPEIVKGAEAALAEVQKKLEAGDAKAAFRLMSKVPPDAEKDGDFAKAAAEVRTQLDAAGTELLRETDADIAAGNHAAAAEKLRDLMVSLTGTKVGDAAKQHYDTLLATPEGKAAVELAKKEDQASGALATAQKLRDEKKHNLAYPRFKQVATAFTGTPSGAEAAKIVKEYEADPAFIQRVTATEVGGKAKAALSMARSYARSGKSAQAKAKYQAIIKDFPNTEYATTAQTEMSAMKR